MATSYCTVPEPAMMEKEMILDDLLVKECTRRGLNGSPREEQKHTHRLNETRQKADELRSSSSTFA